MKFVDEQPEFSGTCYVFAGDKAQYLIGAFARPKDAILFMATKRSDEEDWSVHRSDELGQLAAEHGPLLVISGE
jgi:hypothetical protein